MDVVSGEVDREGLLRGVCRELLKRCPDIVEIVQFGSSVYAPDLARDVDLLVISRDPKDYDVYLSAVDEVDPPFNVDIVVVKPGQELREELVRSVLGAFNILYGNGRYILEYARRLSDPTYEEARAALRAARDYLELALRAGDALLRDRHFREAFDSLFHAARIAAMTYLSTEVARWGLLRMLPKPFDEQFREFIKVLHIRCFYNGEYPRGRVREEFSKWCNRVEGFINGLERETRRKR